MSLLQFESWTPLILGLTLEPDLRDLDLVVWNPLFHLQVHHARLLLAMLAEKTVEGAPYTTVVARNGARLLHPLNAIHLGVHLQRKSWH